VPKASVPKISKEQRGMSQTFTPIQGSGTVEEISHGVPGDEKKNGGFKINGIWFNYGKKKPTQLPNIDDYVEFTYIEWVGSQNNIARCYVQSIEHIEHVEPEISQNGHSSQARSAPTSSLMSETALRLACLQAAAQFCAMKAGYDSEESVMDVAENFMGFVKNRREEADRDSIDF
jgi:hypothetical protein